VLRQAAARASTAEPIAPGFGAARLASTKEGSLRLCGGLGLAGLLACSFLIAAGAAGAASKLVPASEGSFPGWLAGPLSVFDMRLSPYGFDWLLLGMSGCYGLALIGAKALERRTLLAVILILHLIFLVGPPLFSADVFGYVAYARLGALHHLDPYTHGSVAVPLDPVLPFVRWGHLTSPYGPAFTIASYALVPLGVAGSLWTLKLLAVASSLGVVGLVARLVDLLGRPSLPAIALVGLNPLLLVYGVGGAHNDLLVTLVVLAAVTMSLTAREAAGGATLVVAAAMKASAGLQLPFMLVGSARKRALAIGVIAALVLVFLAALAAFGVHGAGFVGQIRLQQHLVAGGSVPNMVGRALGLGGITDGIRMAAFVALAVSIAVALRNAWRAGEGGDWITPAGWATLALLVTTAWLVPWYVIWLLPLAAVSGDRRLEAATLFFCAYVVATRVTFLLG
jgi:hypothetical protein